MERDMQGAAPGTDVALAIVVPTSAQGDDGGQWVSYNGTCAEISFWRAIVEHNRPFGIGLRQLIAVFASDLAYLALGTMNALMVGMTTLTAFLLYGETANGSQYRLTIWAYDKAEAIDRAEAHAKSNRLIYFKVL